MSDRWILTGKLALTCMAAGALFPCSPLDARALPGELAAKKRAIIMMPDGEWRLEEGDDRCRLRRSFTSEKGPGIVLIEQIAPGQRFDLVVAGPDFARNHRGSWFYGGIRSDEEMETIDPLEYAIPGFENALALADMGIDDYLYTPGSKSKPVKAAIDLASAAKVERVVFQRSTVIVSFELGNMAEPVGALNDCLSKLLSEWGLDAAAYDAFTPPQMPDERVYYSRLHHALASKPSNAGHKSLLRVRALIGENGAVRSCLHEYSISSGGEKPDVCADIERMTFTPAKDSEGEPIASVYSRSLILSEFDPWTADSGGQGRWGGF